MKKILLNSCILFVFVSFLLVLVEIFVELTPKIQDLPIQNEHLKYLLEHPEITNEYTINADKYLIEQMESFITKYSIYAAIGFIALFATVYLFVYCNPRLFRLSTWTNLSEEWAKNKQERSAAREAKAEADKQKRIEELQKELEELHGTDKSD